jgi:hypothetical protein
MSVLCEICEFEASGVEVFEVSLQGGNLLSLARFLSRYVA